jgi:biopolymer transport protein TolR
MAFSNGSSADAVLNVTPLIDVLLVLLVIFMVIGPALPHGVSSSIPKAEGGTASMLQPVVVRIIAGPDGSVAGYRLHGEESSFAGLRPRLQQMFAARAVADRTLFVEADRALSYRSVVAVAGMGKAAGASAVALAPERR